jgi:hypothetical protein
VCGTAQNAITGNNIFLFEHSIVLGGALIHIIVPAFKSLHTWNQGLVGVLSRTVVVFRDPGRLFELFCRLTRFLQLSLQLVLG